MNYADISTLTEKELSRKRKELREKMFEANMKNALGQLTNPMSIREMRRDVARLQTAMTAKKAGAVAPTKKAAAAKAPAKRTAKKSK